MSLKPLRSNREPPRTVMAAVSAIWLFALRATLELAIAPEAAPVVPPVMMRLPVMALVVVVVPLTPRFRITPFT